MANYLKDLMVSEGDGMYAQQIALPMLALGGSSYVAPPSTAMTAADGGAGSIAAGTYRYKVTYAISDKRDGTIIAETDPSGTCGLVTIAASRRISLSSIPVSDSSFINCRRIYRQKDGAGNFSCSVTLSNNTSTTAEDNNNSPSPAAPVANTTAIPWLGASQSLDMPCGIGTAEVVTVAAGSNLTIPAGRIRSVFGWSPSSGVVDTVYIASSVATAVLLNSGYSSALRRPILCDEAATLYVSASSSTSANFSVITFVKPALIDPFMQMIDSSTSYTVPTGKIAVLTHASVLSGTPYLRIQPKDGTKQIALRILTGSLDYNSIGSPILLNEGDLIDTNTTPDCIVCGFTITKSLLSRSLADGLDVAYSEDQSFCAAALSELINISPPTTTMTASSSTGGAISADTYRYRVAYALVDNDTDSIFGETEASGTCALVTVSAGSARVNLSSIPTSSDKIINARTIYRKGNSESQYTRIALIEDTTSTSYEDTVATQFSLYVPADRCQTVRKRTGDDTKGYSQPPNNVGYRADFYGDRAWWRAQIRFPLDDLPSDASISQVRLRLNQTHTPTLSSVRVRAYKDNGQYDIFNDWIDAPYGNSPLHDVTFDRSITGNDYGTSAPGGTGDQTYTLSGTIAADVMAARTAGTKFNAAVVSSNEAQDGLIAFQWPFLIIDYSRTVGTAAAPGEDSLIRPFLSHGQYWGRSNSFDVKEGGTANSNLQMVYNASYTIPFGKIGLICAVAPAATGDLQIGVVGGTLATLWGCDSITDYLPLRNPIPISSLHSIVATNWTVWLQLLDEVGCRGLTQNITSTATVVPSDEKWLVTWCGCSASDAYLQVRNSGGSWTSIYKPYTSYRGAGVASGFESGLLLLPSDECRLSSSSGIICGYRFEV